ncbi:MAG: hypothetical protein KTR28_06650 [Micavibrio sp.]|nr:hypothetical protein [Micavibrio sp.]
MRFFKKTAFTLSFAALFLSGAANASNVFQWQSEAGDISVTFSDSWARVNNQGPLDLLTIKAPTENEYAQCVVRAEDDKRFVIYPLQFGPEIQREYVSTEMWEEYFTADRNTVILSVYDDAQLGKGWASVVSASYETGLGPKMVKRSVAFASLYRGKLYSVECSAQEDHYAKWHDAFMDFIKSVDFPLTTNHALSGYYRDFIGDSGVHIKGLNILDNSHY